MTRLTLYYVTLAYDDGCGIQHYGATTYAALPEDAEANVAEQMFIDHAAGFEGDEVPERVDYTVIDCFTVQRSHERGKL